MAVACQGMDSEVLPTMPDPCEPPNHRWRWWWKTHDINENLPHETAKTQGLRFADSHFSTFNKNSNSKDCLSNDPKDQKGMNHPTNEAFVISLEVRQYIRNVTFNVISVARSQQKMRHFPAINIL